MAQLEDCTVRFQKTHEELKVYDVVIGQDLLNSAKQVWRKDIVSENVVFIYKPSQVKLNLTSPKNKYCNGKVFVIH